MSYNELVMRLIFSFPCAFLALSSECSIVWEMHFNRLSTWAG